jgi:hypothetical protein
MTEPRPVLRCFHHWTGEGDPRQLLDPADQYSTPWGGADHGPCDKCEGVGQCPYDCRSCLEQGSDPDCPACAGRVHFLERCPTCEGTGEITNTRRAGISVFPSIAGLLRYMVERDADLDGLVVELDGEPTDDLDLDADSGALLVRPVAIVGAEPVDREVAEELRRRLSATSGP